MQAFNQSSKTDVIDQKMSMWKHKETSDHPSLGAWRGTSNFLHGSKSLMRRWFDEHGPGVSSMLCYAKSLQSCPTLCNAIDGSPPGSPVPGILQARTLESVAISFSNAWKWKWSHSVVSDPPATPWTAAFQAPPSIAFSRQEYWSGVPLPSPSK